MFELPDSDPLAIGIEIIGDGAFCATCFIPRERLEGRTRVELRAGVNPDTKVFAGDDGWEPVSDVNGNPCGEICEFPWKILED